MGRPRTPTAIMMLRDTGAHPERMRLRANEPQPAHSIGPAPGWLNDDQRNAYREIVSSAYPGVLSAADGPIVELAAVLLAQLRGDATTMSAAKMARLHAVLAALGHTPADRSRITAKRHSNDGSSFDF